MITGPRAAIAAAVAGAGVRTVSYLDTPAVGELTAVVTLDTAEPDPTRCAHITELSVLLVSQLDDPDTADSQLEEAADTILNACADVATFTRAQRGTYRDRAASLLLTFQTRQ